MAWASAMTPILMGSAANAAVVPSPRAVAVQRARNDQELRRDILIVMIDFPYSSSAQMGRALLISLELIVTRQPNSAREAKSA
jgi:hypothetical protein